MKEKQYILLVLFNILIGILIYYIRVLSIVYAILIPLVGLYYVIKNQNRNHEVLYVSAYIVGSEVFLRMTGGNLLYESSKYGVMVFLTLGMYYSGFSKNAVPFWIYLLLLLPGVNIISSCITCIFNYNLFNFIYSRFERSISRNRF